MSIDSTSTPLVDIVETRDEAARLEVPPLLIRESLIETLPGSGSIDIERVRAGHSNLTFFITRGDERWVLRRPPRPPVPPKAHDVLREHRLICALYETGVPVPKAIMACADETVIGAPFYVMERLDGVVIRNVVPSGMNTLDQGREAAEAMIDALVKLHSVDVEDGPLARIGRPDGYLGRQVDLWSSQWQRNKTRELPAIEETGRALAANMPESGRPAVVHGDFKLDNLMFSPGPPVEVAGILDWEMATLGDPMTDVGYLAAMWLGHDGSTELLLGLSAATANPVFPSIEELLQRYADKSGRSLDQLAWYRCLAIWKLAILLEGSRKRHLAGTTDDPFFASLDDGVPRLAQYALSLAGNIGRT
ncbi:MAG: phosphotransferase family protein [Actinomycetota bacterium]|nr:phosphotransferase family protein [Actinomycetota bacterium]